LKKATPIKDLITVPPANPATKRGADDRLGLSNKRKKQNPLGFDFPDTPMKMGPSKPVDAKTFTGKRDPKWMNDRGDNFDDYTRGLQTPKTKAKGSVVGARKRMLKAANDTPLPEVVKKHLDEANEVAENISSKIEEVHNLREGAKEVFKTGVEGYGAVKLVGPAVSRTAGAAIETGMAALEEGAAFLAPEAFAVGI